MLDRIYTLVVQSIDDFIYSDLLKIITSVQGLSQHLSSGVKTHVKGQKTKV